MIQTLLSEKKGSVELPALAAAYFYTV